MKHIQQAVQRAYQKISPYVRHTPLEFSPYLSELSGAKVFLKLENWQLTGSFKLRGAMNKILSLSPSEREKGVVTASTGNHAAAVAHTMHTFGVNGTIYLPTTVSPAKVAALKAYQVELAYQGEDCIDTEIFAREIAQTQGLSYISPYNDSDVLAGQGTIALEVCQDLENFDSILVSVGGGGLIAGIGGYLKTEKPQTRIIGCQPTNSPVMYRSIQAGKVVEMESLPTLSDGTAGGMELDSLTFPICQQVVDDFVLVSEDEIKAALLLMLQKHQLMLEGAAALPIASLLKEKARFQGQTLVLVLCGRKMSMEVLQTVLK